MITQLVHSTNCVIMPINNYANFFTFHILVTSFTISYQTKHCLSLTPLNVEQVRSTVHENTACCCILNGYLYYFAKKQNK